MLLGTQPCWIPHALLLEELMGRLIMLLLRCACSNAWWQRGLSRPWLLWGAVVACCMTIAGQQLLGLCMREMWRWQGGINRSGMAIVEQIMWCWLRWTTGTCTCMLTWLLTWQPLGWIARLMLHV